MLKPGGVFCYDTLNRTWLSYLVAIKIGQEWPRWAFLPSVRMKLHPVTADEEGVLLPFESLEAALAFTRDCAR